MSIWCRASGTPFASMIRRPASRWGSRPCSLRKRPRTGRGPWPQRLFSGAVPSSPSRGEHTITINTALPGWHSLGLYAAPGEKITVTVPGDALAMNLSVQIGSHTDQLWHLESWEPFPSSSVAFRSSGPNHGSERFGGLVYCDVPEGAAAARIPVTIKNAVEAPFYRLGATMHEDWRKTNRHRPAPWAELLGKNVIFTVPLMPFALDDPSGVLLLWDQIVAAKDSVRQSPAPFEARTHCRRWQISAGYMHSGYPIMIPTDDSIRLAVSERRIRHEGAWGLFHELGHNHRRVTGHSTAPAR